MEEVLRIALVDSIEYKLFKDEEQKGRVSGSGSGALGSEREPAQARNG
jgi:hypothetical protein